MAEKDIVQNMISRLGQSQDERLAPELDRDHPGFVGVDERSGRDLMRQAGDLASMLRFYRETPEVSSGDWSAYFPAGEDEASVCSVDGHVPPHRGLFGAFLNLYRYPQQALNAITARHLDFQLLDVLGFRPIAARPDRAHLLVELKKGVPQTKIAPEQRFTAGKDARGVEILFAPTREFIVGESKVQSVRSVFRNAEGVFFAPVAKSSDGLGGELPKDAPAWRPFGGPDLPPAHVGFALASPVLRLGEGTRHVRIEVGLANASAQLVAFDNVFEAYVTGPKGWVGPLDVGAARSGDTLSLDFTLDPGSPPVVDFDLEAHVQDFDADAPVVQVLLKPGAPLRYLDLADLCVSSVRIHVDVDGLKSLALENDDGSLNPKKAFLPFGAQPIKGSHFFIGSAEALSKRLASLRVKLTWQGAPANLVSHYKEYKHFTRMANGLKADLVYEDRGGEAKSAVVDIMDRDDSGTTTLVTDAPAPTPPKKHNKHETRILAYVRGGSRISQEMGLKLARSRPMLLRKLAKLRARRPPAPRAGFITLVLREDFLHADYRRETIEHALAQDKVVLPEPYTPKVQAISLAYSADSDSVEVGGDSEDAFTNLDLQFFHVGCFGPMRDHGFLRARVDFVRDKRVSLLPRYASEGELLVGIAGARAGDGVTLLMEAAEGSADPELDAQELEWSVLCDNYWRVLTPQELVMDTSNDLRTSGIVALTLPHETTTEHTWLDTGLVWLRAAVPQASGATCQLVDVAANAVEVAFVDNGNDPRRLARPLPAESIAKLKAPPASVKSVAQRGASFGGSEAETPRQVSRRAAERLRHRNRCIAPWDYERMLLEAFPGVHKVKCIPHASIISWLAPGHVMLVVVPDLRNPNAIDPLRPRVDLDTLARMEAVARRHAPMGIEIRVKNPRYRRVRLDFKVRFRPGFAFNFYRDELERALIRVLAPWAHDAQRRLEFGGRIYRSVLLDFVEELPYVDFVTDFKLGVADESGAVTLVDASEVAVNAPDAILVPDSSHAIGEVPAP